MTIEPGKRGGRPCIRGLRITVWDVLGWLGAGMTEDQILAEHPDPEKARLSLLPDENLSPRLTPRLASLFPGMLLARDVGLKQAGTTRSVPGRERIALPW
jgi:hypothetical protein